MAPHDVEDMFEGFFLATMIKDTQLEEVAYDEDFLLARAVKTGWKCYKEFVRDVDELVAVAVETIEENVTDGKNADKADSDERAVFEQEGPLVPTGHLCRMRNGQ